MKTVRDFKVKKKRVLVRCDFNVALDKEGNILDDFRIEKTIPTIEYLIKNGAKVILMSHLGRPDGKKVETLKLDKVQERLTEYLDLSVTKAPDCVGKEIEEYTKELQAGEILLLENLRFHKEETQGNKEFAQKLSKLADLYINDAFGVSHRSHASVTGVPKFLTSGVGLLLEKEIKVLSGLIQDPDQPLVSIIGGAKVETKIKLLKKLLEDKTHLLLGGVLANTVLKAKKVGIGQSKIEPKMVELAKKMDLTNSKLHLPVDVLVASNSSKNSFFIRAIGEVKKGESIFDIGPDTCELFENIIKRAKTIFWNGPLGMIEKKDFSKGTLKIAQAVAGSDAFSVVGGGETVEFLNKKGLSSEFNHVSTGGGAMLCFLSGEKLPGLEALK